MLKEIIRLEPREYSILKLVEELSELSEVAIKLVTKPTEALEGKRLEHLVEELGDVLFRTELLVENLKLNKEVSIRFNRKVKQTLEVCKERYG